jgi:hypothetical protein
MTEEYKQMSEPFPGEHIVNVDIKEESEFDLYQHKDQDYKFDNLSIINPFTKSFETNHSLKTLLENCRPYFLICVLANLMSFIIIVTSLANDNEEILTPISFILTSVILLVIQYIYPLFTYELDVSTQYVTKLINTDYEKSEIPKEVLVKLIKNHPRSMIDRKQVVRHLSQIVSVLSLIRGSLFLESGGSLVAFILALALSNGTHYITLLLIGVSIINAISGVLLLWLSRK